MFKNNLIIFIRSLLAGIMISIGGTVNLMVDNKIIGSFLFSIGLFMIVINAYNLYTGKIGYIVFNGHKYIKELLITLIGNFLGTVLIGYSLHLTRIIDIISDKARVLCQIKLADSLISIFILSIFCGILMFLAVDLYKKLKDSGKYIAVFICVMVFILSGFEHCVANMYYFSVSSMWSFKTLLYMLIMIIGNSCGSIIIALGNKIVTKK